MSFSFFEGGDYVIFIEGETDASVVFERDGKYLGGAYMWDSDTGSIKLSNVSPSTVINVEMYNYSYESEAVATTFSFFYRERLTIKSQ